MLTLDVAWHLAKAWYTDRLEPTWKRKSREEVEALFKELGMVGDFWSLPD